MNSKKNNSHGQRQDQAEKLLISYGGAIMESESDSDGVQPLDLPPTKLRRPRSRYLTVSVYKDNRILLSGWQILYMAVSIGVSLTASLCTNMPGKMK